jgi:SAM-dependent methyltransferase
MRQLVNSFLPGAGVFMRRPALAGFFVNLTMDSSGVFKYHRDMLSRYGRGSSLALGWRDRHSQLVRFDVLAKIGDLDGKSVLDVGCGHGDLLTFLLERYLDLGSYCGVDFIPEMIEEAKGRFEGPAVSFWPVSFMSATLPVYDYVLASGSLNYAGNDPDYIYKAINRLFKLARVGLGFNLLRSVAYEGVLTAYDPEDILTYCRTLCDKVVLITNYDPEDFTIYLYK